MQPDGYGVGMTIPLFPNNRDVRPDIKRTSCGQHLGKRIMDINDKSLRCPKCGSILKE